MATATTAFTTDPALLAGSSSLSWPSYPRLLILQRVTQFTRARGLEFPCSLSASAQFASEKNGFTRKVRSIERQQKKLSPVLVCRNEFGATSPSLCDTALECFISAQCRPRCPQCRVGPAD